MTILKFDSEQDWLAARKKNINSTEIAALFGLSAYKTRLQLWAEKSGLAESSFEDTAFTRWGRRLQLPVAAGICEDNGWTAQDLGLVYLQDDDNRLGSSMDVLANCPERGCGLLEIKTTTALSEDYGWFKDRAPVDYEFQIQCQLHLAKKNGAGPRWGAIAVLDGRKNTRVYMREYDQDLGSMIDAQVSAFWSTVDKATPPPPDFLADGDLLEKLRGPVQAGTRIDLSADARAMALLGAFLAEKEEAKKLKEALDAIDERRQKIKNELLSIVGTAESAKLGDFLLKARIQEVAEKKVNAYSFRRFDLSKAKGESK